MPCRRTDRASERGLTLLEVMLAVGMTGLFLSAVSESLTVTLRAVHASDQRETIRLPAAGLLDRFARDAMVATDMDQAEDGRIQFDTPSLADVSYVYDAVARTVTRDDAAAPAVILLRDVTAFDLNYLNAANADLATPVAAGTVDTIRVVQLLVTVASDGETLSMTRAAYLRNM